MNPVCCRYTTLQYKKPLRAIWWAELDSNQRSQKAEDLQSSVIAAIRPTHMCVLVLILKRVDNGGKFKMKMKEDVNSNKTIII